MVPAPPPPPEKSQPPPFASSPLKIQNDLAPPPLFDQLPPEKANFCQPPPFFSIFFFLGKFPFSIVPNSSFCILKNNKLIKKQDFYFVIS